MPKEQADEVVDAELEDALAVVAGKDLSPALREEQLPEVRTPSLLGTSDPIEHINRASAVATQLDNVLRDKELFKTISAKRHVLVEGWTLLGSMMGVYPILVECEPITCPDKTKTDKEPDATVNGWYAIVEARTADGALVGRAKALCLRNETRWKAADEYAVASMAQTRATSKALRQPLGFIVHLAGYSATPAEEIPPQPAMPRPQRMMDRIGELCLEIDSKQGREVGYTWNSVNEQARLQYDEEVPELTKGRNEDALSIIGTALLRLYNEVLADPEKYASSEFKITGGDDLFSESYE